MIQNNELRIGNILNHDTVEGDILPHIITWQSLGWLTEDPKGFNLVHSPIPLTEEWLLRFGFKKSLKDTYQIIINGLELYVNYKNGITWLNSPKNNQIVMLPKMNKHIYQLQNLYFALTGEELELKNIT